LVHADPDADIDCDETVNILDAIILSNNFPQHYHSLPFSMQINPKS
jgi:hypothetical protein